jgi:hypothetical protein
MIDFTILCKYTFKKARRPDQSSASTVCENNYARTTDAFPADSGTQLSDLFEPLPIVRRLLFPTMILPTIQPNPPPVRILLTSQHQPPPSDTRIKGIPLTSKTINHPLNPVKIGECCVPQISNHLTHAYKSCLLLTASVTGSQLRSSSAFTAFSLNSRKRPAQSFISQMTAKREPSGCKWSREPMRCAPSTRSYQARERERFETANLRWWIPRTWGRRGGGVGLGFIWWCVELSILIVCWLGNRCSWMGELTI